MNLKGRNLSVRMRGEDVALLHKELRQLKFTIPNDELQKRFFGKATHTAVLDFQKKHGLEPTGLVDEGTAELINRELEEQSLEREFEVRGTVRHPNGRLFVGGLVRAFDKDLRSEQLLGETGTDDKGHYEIKYSPDQFRRAEKKSADLLMRVYSAKGETLYEPGLEEVHFNAPRVTVIDIQLKIGDRHGESEYERLLRSIQPLLEKVPIRELREDEEVQDITFLHRETDWSVDRLEHVVMAHRLSVISEISPEFYYALLRENTLLKVDIAATFQVRFRIDLQTEPKSLFYEVVSLAPEVIRRAVKQAIQHETVPEELANQLDDILKKLTQRADEAQAYRRNEQPRKIFNLIEKNLVAGKVAEALEIIRQDFHGDIPRLIDRLRKASAVLSHEDSMEAETSLRLGEVLAFDEDIISSVKESQGIRKPEDVRKLAALNASGWKRVLTKSAAKIKAGGAPVKTDLIGLHASSLVRKMEKRFPTVAFAAQLERDKKSKLSHRKAMSQLFKKHPDFDLATTNIDLFFKRSKVASLAGEDGAGMKESLKAVQRVFKLAPTYRQTNALMQVGISSAYGIYAMGQTQFLKRFAGTGGTFSQSEARVIYQKASDIHTASLMLAADIESTVSASMIHSLGDLVSPDKLEAVTKDFPNLKSLFQLTDLCQCEHCRSVYSPAAYLVDVLQFLKKRLVVDTTAATPLSIKIAKDVLFDRRPDIGDLDLSCPNTDTPLPYIDIVCELLEEVVKPDPGIPYSGTIVSGPVPATLLTLLQARGYPFTNQAMLSELNGCYILRDKAVVCKMTPDGAGAWIIKRLRQTHLSAEELSAAPEYLNEDAYYELQKAKYAFGLPFDLYHQECKGYFEQFDIRRDHLMRVLQQGSNPNDYDIAADALGITDSERKLIVTPDAANQWLYWNKGSATVVTDMQVVDTFLTKTNLTYEQLVALLAQSFINPSDTMFIHHLDNTCNSAQKQIANLDTNALDRMHRFLRLWQKTGWSMDTLNQAITYPRLGNGQLDDACLTKISSLVALKEKLGIPVDEICVFYGVIPIEGEGSRYQQVFLNKAANGSIDEALLPENVLKNEGAPNPKKLADCTSTLSLCLGIKPADMDLLLESLDASAILSFANLAALYSMNLLAKKLGLKIDEYLTLQSLTGISVFNSPADTLRFIEKVEKVKASGVKAADLQYLLKHNATDLEARIIKEESITVFLKGLQQELQQAFEETRSPYDEALTADENKGYVKDLLGKLPNFAEVELSKFMTIVDYAWQDPAQTPAAFIDAKLKDPQFKDLLDTAAIKIKEAALETEKANLISAGKTGDDLKEGLETYRKELIEAILDTLSAYFFSQARVSILVRALMDNFKTTEVLTTILLRSARLKAPASAGNKTFLELLGTDDFIDRNHQPPVLPDITQAAFSEQYSVLRLYHKMAPFVASLPLQSHEIEWMLLHNAELGWMELDRLPYDSITPPVSFDQWEMLQDAVGLIKAHPPIVNPDDIRNPISFYTLLELVLQPAAPIDSVLELLSRLGGWDETVLHDLDSLFGFSIPDITAYRLPATYQRLEKAAVLLRRLGLNVNAALALIKPQLMLDDTKTLRLALKARYEDTQWLGVLKGIQDKLRNQKRDALVAYILATNTALKSSNDLYDHLLIDVEMSACQPTSRIVQAHGTLQLFVQRCLMGLEPKCVADVKGDPDWEQWKWMKNYRVWEANRKVFLYPENWIEPELRDDKSFLFTNLETELMQNELSDRNVEDATIRYLEKLDEIALLEVVAVYYQADIYTMHVFARTKGGDPAMYYYRRFEKESYWTPWEKVDLEITGDHLLAFERNNRLYLAWPLFTEDAKQDQSIKIPKPSEIPAGGKEAEKTLKRWKVQLAISEYSGKRWLPKKVSKEALCGSGYYEILPQKEDFRFTIVDLKQIGFFVACYYIENGKFPEYSYTPDSKVPGYLGAFSLVGCKGYPEPIAEPVPLSSFQFMPQFRDTAFKNLRYREMNEDAPDDLAIATIFNQAEFTPILQETPGIFKITYPQQMSLIDLILLWLGILQSSKSQYPTVAAVLRSLTIPLGTLMPFFYEDYNREYVVIPGFYPRTKDALAKNLSARTFSDVLKFVEDVIALCLKYLQKLQEATDPHPVLVEIVTDEEYIRLAEEFVAYRTLLPGYGYQFKNFYHPLVCSLKTAIYRDGIPGLMKHETQMQKTTFDFQQKYNPTALTVVKPYPLFPLADSYPIEDINFDKDGSYASYNWELFFHLPFEIAIKLSQDQRFEEAMDWFHYIFNPMGAVEGDAPAKYWVTKPFSLCQKGDYEKQRIDSILYAIAADPQGTSISDLADAVAEWRNKPFKPHVVARSRPVAYQKAVLMKYIDNLVNWGDFLFRQDTMESVNQATQLYVLTEKLLGPKPRIIPPVVEPPAHTYNQLEPKIDLFGNALLELENVIPDLNLPQDDMQLDMPLLPLTLASLYFCIPQNDQLLATWDLVGDRLLKIRHCQNIDGVERMLALFAPPIDPGALVRAAAAGLDISDIIAGLSAPLPIYRFHIMSKKATELAQEVRVLGTALLGVLEKKDAEGLALLRSTHERRVLDAVKGLKELKIQEALETQEAMRRAKAMSEENREFYRNREIMNSDERLAEDLRSASKIISETVSAGYLLASALKAIPTFLIGAAGFGGTPTAETETPDFGDVAISAADVALAIAGFLDKGAALASEKAIQKRRKEDWAHSERMGDLSSADFDKKIAAQEICIDIAKKDLANHIIQMENAKAADDYMRSKFTNQELYGWMTAQVSSVYFQAYKLAFDAAKKAERCFCHELGSASTFIGFTYWDSLKKGLMAADHLLHDIKRMEVAYLDQNKREYELTKHVSVAMLDPMALLRLRNNGKCTINLPEVIFDLDHPGHYMRRIKSVSISIPCDAAPHTSVSCKLSQVSNKYRKNMAFIQSASTAKDKYGEVAGNDDRFVYNVGAIQSIATSHGQSDSGMFELDFRDDRYLPFEGTGAISTWQLEMPAAFKQFDYSAISDVVIHLQYTARDGGSGFKKTVEEALQELLNEELLSANETGLFTAFDIQRDFPAEWQSLKQTNGASFTLSEQRLPVFVQGHAPSIDSTTWLARVKGNPPTFVMNLDGTAFNLNSNPDLGSLCIGTSDPITLGTTFTLSATSTADLEELVLVIKYKISS